MTEDTPSRVSEFAQSEVRRGSFGSVAAAYDDERPRYPEELVDDALRDVPSDGRLLEIGPGTGIATLQFAQRGPSILGLELDESMAGIARNKLHQFPGVQIVTTSFEDWAIERGAFDVVFAGQAWHWITPGAGFPRAHEALRDGGRLALFWNREIVGAGGGAFFEACDAILQRLAPELHTDPRRDGDLGNDRFVRDIEASGYFVNAAVETYRWSETRDTASYVRYLSTHSNWIALHPDVRANLLDAIAEVTERDFGGRVHMHFRTALYTADKR